MRYMGINNIEDYIGWLIHDFHKNHINRKILKIIVPQQAYGELLAIVRGYDERRYLTKEEIRVKLKQPPITYNDVLIVGSKTAKNCVVVPAGGLAEALYE